MKLLFILLLGLGFTQTKLETRVYELPRINFQSYNWFYDLDISEITGFDLDYANIKIAKVIDYSIDNNYCEIRLQSSNIQYSGSEYWLYGEVSLQDGGSVQYGTASTRGVTYDGSNNIRFDFEVADGWVDLILSITAEFPEEDTGYIEEGYQFCVQPGANLLSFPCDNPISVNQSLPQGAENFITQIVGQGVAATYNPALGWVGSLDNFSPGSGYWFKSNESLCFEYDCVED